MTDSADWWRPVYIGMGSNLGDSVAQIKRGVERIAALPSTRLIARASLYRAAPLGGVEQADFVNTAVAVLTQLLPERLLDELQQIERAAGRTPGGVRWGPRELDLDILVYSNARISNDLLTVPHPGIAQRNFVLLPLLELAPDLVIPGLGRVASITFNPDEPRITRIG